MQPRLKSTRAARELIKAHEPFQGEAIARGRRWVVGYGHTAAAKPGMTIKPDDADLLLIYDVIQAEQAVLAITGSSAHENVRNALISFAASVGLSAFKVSDVARLAKAGRFSEAAATLESWVRVQEDGRLVTSEALVQRRADEKALLLSGLAPIAAEEPEEVLLEAVETETPEEPEELVETNTSDDETVAQDDLEEPRLGPLVDVEIEIEDEHVPVAEPIDGADDVDEPEAVSDTAEAVEEATEDSVTEAAEDEAEDQPIIEPAETAVDEAEDDEETSDAEDLKKAQDLAIAAVMARMAGDISSSVNSKTDSFDTEVEEENETEAQIEETVEPVGPVPAGIGSVSSRRLGYYFLKPDIVDLNIDERDDVEQTQAEPEADAPIERAAESDAAVVVTEDVYAPPHPSDAPASAPGISGEIDGPLHGDDDQADGVIDDTVALEPALVGGEGFKQSQSDAKTPKARGGDLIYTSCMIVGIGLMGMGGWEIYNNLDSYMAAGIDFSPLGPVAFGSGVLLAVASGWFVFGHMKRSKP